MQKLEQGPLGFACGSSTAKKLTPQKVKEK